MSEKYVPEGVLLVCDKGLAPSQLLVTHNSMCSIYGANLASEKDKVPNENLMPFGKCKVDNKACVPAPVKWDKLQSGVAISEAKLLTEDSILTCSVGGKISIHFTVESAEAALPEPDKGWKDHLGGLFNKVEEGADFLIHGTRDLFGIEDGSFIDKALFDNIERMSDFQIGFNEGLLKGAGSLVEFAYDVGKWSFNRTPPYSFTRMQQNYEEDVQMLKDMYNTGESLLKFSYRNSIINLATNPEDFYEQQQTNQRIFEGIVDHISNMDSRDWGDVSGQIAFEVLTEAATGGGAMAGNLRHLNKLDNVADGMRALETLDDVSDGMRALDKVEDASDLYKAIDNIDDASSSIKQSQNIGPVTNGSKPPVMKGRKPKTPEAPVLNADGSLTEYGKWYYDRPSGYRSGVRDSVWDMTKGDKHYVRDPVTGKFMSKDDAWHMGHKPGYEFRSHRQSAAERGIGREEFLDEHNKIDHYRPELPESNMSHKGEDMSGEYLGDKKEK